MARKKFGTKGQIRFDSDGDYFEALGFLAKNDGTTSLHWEKNEEQGAWGSEGRIHCHKDLDKFPSYFSSAFTAGRGGVLKRINCNDYVGHIFQEHGFVEGKTQDRTSIISTIPKIHIDDFNRGLAL
jgi:hypothetical protein